jgi:hypothetical protein
LARHRFGFRQDAGAATPERAKAPVTYASFAPGFGHDFGTVRVHPHGQAPEAPAAPNAASFAFQTPGPTPKPAPPKPAPAATPTLSVDKIDIIDSSTGAIGGFVPITSGDLNSPGPFNNPTTGAVNNVQQIHFHLDHGSSADLTPTRIVRGSNWLAGVEIKHPADQVLPPGSAGPPAPGGFGGVLDAPDGPAAHEIKRPSTDKLVVADAPGIGALAASHYPYIHKSTFTLTVAGPSNTPVARIQYGVRIQKNDAKDIPNTENRIFAIQKDDLVRNKAIP